jgi:hypothetical protein
VEGRETRRQIQCPITGIMFTVEDARVRVRSFNRPMPYILYFPRSSSFSPSRYFRSSSEVTRSDIFAACFEFFSTSSSTNIGQSTRSASASASDGR